MPAPFKLPRCSRAAQLVTHGGAHRVSVTCSAAVSMKTPRSSLHCTTSWRHHAMRREPLVAVGKIGQGHAEGTADVRMQLLDGAGEPVGRQPLGRRIGFEEGTLDPLWAGAYDAVQRDGRHGHSLGQRTCLRATEERGSADIGRQCYVQQCLAQAALVGDASAGCPTPAMQCPRPLQPALVALRQVHLPAIRNRHSAGSRCRRDRLRG